MEFGRRKCKACWPFLHFIMRTLSGINIFLAYLRQYFTAKVSNWHLPINLQRLALRPVYAPSFVSVFSSHCAALPTHHKRPVGDSVRGTIQRDVQTEWSDSTFSCAQQQTLSIQTQYGLMKIIHSGLSAQRNVINLWPWVNCFFSSLAWTRVPDLCWGRRISRNGLNVARFWFAVWDWLVTFRRRHLLLEYLLIWCVPSALQTKVTMIFLFLFVKWPD